MRKKDEISKPGTCLAHAHPDEMVFVLLSRDVAAPATIRFWAAERLRLGKNVESDPKIREALDIARVMEVEGRQWVGDPAGSFVMSEDGELTELVTCESCSARVDPKLATLDTDEGVWFCRPCGRKIASEEQKHG